MNILRVFSRVIGRGAHATHFRFKSNDEFFQAVRDLITQLELTGQRGPAAELRAGFAYLNGLTDGSALFLESIEKVRAAGVEQFSRDQKRALDAICSATRSAIYRR